MGVASDAARSTTGALILLGLIIAVISQETPRECHTSAGAYGACVFLTSCPALLSLLRTGDPAYHDLVKKNHCGFDGAMPKVCCSNEVDRNALNFPKDVVTATSSSRLTQQPSSAVTAPAPQTVRTTPLVATNPPTNAPTAAGHLPPSLPHRPAFSEAANTADFDRRPLEDTLQVQEEAFPNTTPNPIQTMPPPRTTTRRYFPQGPIDPPVVSGGVERNMDSQALLPNKTVCGNIGTNDKIYGGTNTSIGDFPWMALLKYKVGETGSYGCGGVLINNRYVLTAAHCVMTSNSYKLTQVRLGEWDLTADQDCENDQCSAPPLDFDVEETMVHQEFVPRSLINDIALIRLAAPVNFTEWIQPICLPDAQERDFTEETFWVAGWGQTEIGKNSDRKSKIEVSYVEREVCSTAYRRLQVDISAGNLCAGGRRGQDTCSGDSGGALMKQFTFDHGTNYYAVGVVSFGPKRCGLEGWPGVYTKLSYYIDWIRAHLKP